MALIRIEDKKGQAIDDWRNWPPPKRAGHWRAGRSAMENARAWFTSPVPICPPEIAALLESNRSTEGIVLSKGMPEHVTRLPEKGEGRNHDLLLLGACRGQSIVVSIEAKADEQFDKIIEDYCRKATPTACRRVETLLKMVFGPAACPDALPWRGLRYQLLTAVAGMAIEAAERKAPLAVLVIHEFRTEKADPKKCAANAEDLTRFVQALLPLQKKDIEPGRLYGPVQIKKQTHLPRDVKILVGKAVYDWSDLRVHDGR